MTNIAVAAITSFGLVLVAMVNARANKRTQDEVHSLGESMATNHGRRPGEYLEDIARVSMDVRRLGVELKASTDMILRQLTEHTAQDDRNFGELRRSIEHIERRLDDVA